MRDGNRHADIADRRVLAKCEERHERVGLGVGTRRCKLLYMEWINKDLLYSTENNIQYLIINHSRKE